MCAAAGLPAASGFVHDPPVSDPTSTSLKGARRTGPRAPRAHRHGHAGRAPRPGAAAEPATYRRTVRAGTGPAIGSSNRRIRFAVNRGSSHSHCWICSRHGPRVPGRGGDTRTGGVDRPMARRTVLTSNFNRLAISFFGTPSTRCRWRR